MYLVGLHWSSLHVYIPHLKGQEISGEEVATAMAELGIRD